MSDTPTDDLLERARAGQCPENMGCGTMSTCACALLQESSDTIQSLQERVKALEAEVVRLTKVMHESADDIRSIFGGR